MIFEIECDGVKPSSNCIDIGIDDGREREEVFTVLDRNSMAV